MERVWAGLSPFAHVNELHFVLIASFNWYRVRRESMMDAKRLGRLSKSKAKRLKTKAKYERIKAAMNSETSKRMLAEGSVRRWRNKANLYKT